MDQPTLIALVDRLRGLRREQSTIEFKSNWDKPEGHLEIPIFF